MSSVDVTLPIDHLLNANPSWIREDLGDLAPLMKSMKKEGQQQPVLVDETYRVIDGARRVVAAANLGWSSVHVVVAHSFFVTMDHLVASQDTPFQLPHDIFGRMEILEILRTQYKPHSMAMAAKTRGANHAKDLVRRVKGATVDIPVAMGLNANQTEEIGRVRRLYVDPRHSPEARRMLREVMYPLRFQVYGILDAMRTVLHVDRVVSSKKVITDQKAIIPRALQGIQGGILALPKPEEVDPGHSREDITAWLKHVEQLQRGLFYLRKQFKAMLNETEGDQE